MRPTASSARTIRTRIRTGLGFAATRSGSRLDRPEDFEAAAAFHDVGIVERVSHPEPDRVGSLAGPGDEPEVSAVEQVGGGLRDDSIHDAAAGADRRIAEDVIEDHVFDRSVDVADADLRVSKAVRGDVRAGQRDRALIHVRQDDVTASGEASRDDTDRAVTASEIQDRFTRPYHDRLEEELRPAVEPFAGEHARVRLKAERTTPNRDRDPRRFSLRHGSCLEVLATHAGDESSGPGLRPTFTSSGRERV